jgi:hypothetical protein
VILKEKRVRASADLGLVRGAPECTVQALAGFCRKFSFTAGKEKMQMFKKNRNVSLPAAALIGVLLLGSALSAQSNSPEARSGQWRIAGQNLSNTWSQPAEH